MTIERANNLLFDHYLIVDWSAANQPKKGRDSIWICHRGPEGERCDNPPTRREARMLLAKRLAVAVSRNERVLVGFDFPFGYPAGFAARLRLTGTPWRAVWAEIVRLTNDRADNENNRFSVATALNERVSGSAFPFWGCPPRKAGAFLRPKHHGRHDGDGLAEKRLIDTWMVGAQPCWKLLGAGSVGSQVLTGIPVVHALRFDRRWADRAMIWPFETGLRTPTKARIVFAEVWPSWWKWQQTRRAGEIADKAQVRHVARLFAVRDRAGMLDGLFIGARSLGPAQRRVVETEEAWTLGVTAPRRPRASRRPQPGLSTASTRLRRPDRNDDQGRHFEARSDEAISPLYDYQRDPAAIYQRSFALVRQEADLARFPASLRPLAVRLAHAAGDTAILADLAWSRGAAAAGRRALEAGAAILVDSEMTAAGISRVRLPAANPVICMLLDPGVAQIAAAQATTRSAAAVELWRPHLVGAVVVIGNAPTALFRLLELIAAGGDLPALVLGFPVGFVGAAEAKAALVGFGRGLRYVTLQGRRGGSALAAAAVNALCGEGTG
jgi:precorrin-8X/cobalt-precorrin-8 methylmutase